MPGYFKKRRASQGPNKNEQKIIRARNAENQTRLAGTLSSRFPTLRHLRIHLVFLGAQQHVLDDKTLALDPADAAVFTVPCPGRCGQGSFDFGGKIAETIGARLPYSESSAKCPESLYAASAETCGCEVKCRMDVDYLPAEIPT